ncbi:hypothetical protein F5B21DRAFT_337799 [Xylaria acuta]|nr:hypothetical protein F5B21DRAFT_337799 [Xylaria acuta]
MRLLREAVSGIWRLQSRGPTVPSLCYDACNNANLAAQSVGKTPELCDSNSVFFKYYSACQDCINTYSNNSQETTRYYLDQAFGQYLDYCGGAVPITGTPISIPSSTPSLTEDTVVVTILYTGTVDGVRTV